MGDEINIVGNGIVKIAPGFQMIFTANLKSEKNPERQDLPPEIAREFEQNNLEVQYIEPEEAYDIMLSRLLNQDGSLDMSFYDLHTTLPNLCKAMAEIQESYTNETDKKVAKRAGTMPASGKVYSLKKFVMTQGSVEAILQAWLVERRIGKKERSFSEFLDERLKIALTFKEYPKEDRILAAKILASRGFLLTLTAKDIDLPEDIFVFNPIKAMRGDEAVKELKEKSGAIKHLTLREAAVLDPFEMRKRLLEDQADEFLGAESEGGDPFLKDVRSRFKKLFGKEKNPSFSTISTDYTYTNPQTGTIERQETITLDLEAKLQDFLFFYKTTQVDLPPDFEDTIRDIWTRNYDDIQSAIEENGFDDLLIIPSTLDIGDLSEKMKMENGYYDYIQSNTNVQTLRGISLQSQNTDKPRILLVHKAQNIKDRPELASTLKIKGKDVNLAEILTLEDYLIFQRKYFEETQKHLDEDGWTWLATKSGARLVHAAWRPGSHRLRVGAFDLADQRGDLGARSSRCFF